MAGAVPNTWSEAHETAFEAFGVRIGVGTNDPRVWSRLDELVPPHSRPCGFGDVEHHFSVGTDEGTMFTVRYDVRNGVAAQPLDAVSYVASKVDLELALGLLDTHVQSCLGLHAPERIFIEAGAVARNGRALLLPGKALSGKTTLVAALVRAGCVYYSDQYALLDERGRLHPYARPPSLLAQAQLGNNAHGHVRAALSSPEPLPIDAVVVTTYSPEAEWRPRELSRGQGVTALLSHAVPGQHRTEEAMRAISRALEHEPIMLASARGEADVVAPSLLAALERRGPQSRAADSTDHDALYG